MGIREIREWFLYLSEAFEKDYEIIEKQKDENKIEVQEYCESIIGKYSRVLICSGGLRLFTRTFCIASRVEDIYNEFFWIYCLESYPKERWHI